MTEVETPSHVAPLPGQNGTAPSPQGPRLPRREVWEDLPEDAYPGFRVKLWANFPKRLEGDLASGDQARVAVALQQIVCAHNNWCDEDGTPFPPASEAAFWDAVPTELAATVVALISRALTRLPNSLAPQTRGR